MRIEYTIVKWALLWHSENKRDGVREYIIRDGCTPVLFSTRAKAREYAQVRYGYITHRKDLRNEPHGWRMPRPVRVRIEVLNNRTVRDE